MRKVRRDVIEKLLVMYKKMKITNPQQGGRRYSTAKADHYLRVIDVKYCFTSKNYDGTYCHTEIEMNY